MFHIQRSCEATTSGLSAFFSVGLSVFTGTRNGKTLAKKKRKEERKINLVPSFIRYKLQRETCFLFSSYILFPFPCAAILLLL